MTLSSLLSSVRRRFVTTSIDPETCRFRETMLVLSVERDNLDDTLAALSWTYGQLVKGKALYDAYGSEPPLVVIDHGDRVLVFTAPNGLKSDIFCDQMRDSVEAMQESAAPFCDATFLLSFGAGHEMQLVEVLSMTGVHDDTRPALAIALTAWEASKPTALDMFRTSGTVWRPSIGLSCRMFRSAVCLHAYADNVETAAAMVENEAFALVERECGRLLPLSSHPANTIVLDLANGCAYDMMGGISVPANKIARSPTLAFA
jgi:hypothetical protein